MLCMFLPAVSLGRGWAALRLGRRAQRAQPGWAVFEIPANGGARWRNAQPIRRIDHEQPGSRRCKTRSKRSKG